MKRIETVLTVISIVILVTMALTVMSAFATLKVMIEDMGDWRLRLISE